MLELSQRDARRLAVRAQLLARPRPDSLLDAAETLLAVLVDHTAYVAPSADLVFWSRLGRAFTREDLRDAIESRTLVEYRGHLRPASVMRYYAAEMAAWPALYPEQGWRDRIGDWVDANDHAREDILDQLRADGPLSARELDVDFAVPWRSTGWNNHKNVPMMLERMEERGEVAVSAREGKERVWDLAERIYPRAAAVPLEEAMAERARLVLRSLGIARARDLAHATEPVGVGAVGLEARVEGVRGVWRVDAELLDAGFTGRTAALSPLDRLVFDRKRMTDIFAFDYALEMYKPAAKRKWGYYALPVLHRDHLVGKLDVQSVRERGVLQVHAVHEDSPWSDSLRNAVDVELRSLAQMLNLELRVTS